MDSIVFPVIKFTYQKQVLPAGKSVRLPRDPSSKEHIICCTDTEQPWFYVDVDKVQEGIETLKKRGGSCAVAAGPRTCVDLTCDDQHEIVLCNDNGFPIAPNCDYLATYAEEIISECGHVDGLAGDVYACGQQ